MSQGKTPGLFALSFGKLPCCVPSIVVTLKLFNSYPKEVTMGPELQRLINLFLASDIVRQ